VGAGALCFLQNHRGALSPAPGHFPRGAPPRARDGVNISSAPDNDRANAEVWLNKATVLRGLQRNKESLDAYDEALSIRPDYWDALYNRGFVLMDLGRKEDALVFYEKALLVYPTSISTLVRKGQVLMELERGEEALGAFREALQQDEYAPEIWTEIGLAQEAIGNDREAVKAYREALRLDGDAEKAQARLRDLLAT
jgi:tetratricopeptide (TPR) repeat protein